jgi:hypothetical protein
MRRAGLLALGTALPLTVLPLTVLPLTVLGVALAARLPSAELSLRPSFGGAVLEGRITAGSADELTGVWSSGGRTRLLRCMPRCQTVGAIPVQGTLMINADTPYRVAVAGEFRSGQRVKLALRFRSAPLLNMDATVVHP